MAVELRNLLGSNLGVERRLSATLVFDYPTVRAVADYLSDEVLGLGAPADSEAQAEATLATRVEALEELSDDDVERLFAERLGTR
jgi:hypothetical protein